MGDVVGEAAARQKGIHIIKVGPVEVLLLYKNLPYNVLLKLK